MRILIKPKPSQPQSDLVVKPLAIAVPSRPMRILDFDVEARPLSWISGDYVSKEVTAIAWKFIGEPGPVSVYLLGECDSVDMLRAFVDAFDMSDMVTGHYIK